MCWCRSTSPVGNAISASRDCSAIATSPTRRRPRSAAFSAIRTPPAASTADRRNMAARCAWLFGAGRVIVIDHIDYRLEFVRDFAPAEVYNFKELDDVVLFMKKTTDGLGADVCIDAVGAEATGSMLQTILGKRMKLEAGSAIALHWAINSVKKGGIISIVGVYGPTGNMVPIGNVVNKGPLEDIADAYHLFSAKLDDCIKPVLVPAGA